MILKIKKIIITLGISFISSTALANYVLVGNGGEGYESNGELYTRDLYDYDLHQTPWFGGAGDSILATELKSWNPLNLTAEEKELLLRKLTDLNSAYMFLGDDLLLALEYFHWSYTDQNLVLLEPDEIRKPVEPGKRVSIANRFGNSIVINKKHFQRLNSKNKVALILHEAVFSLGSLTYQNNGEATPSLAATRLIVSTLFNEELLKKRSTKVLFRNQLRLSLQSDLFRAFDGSNIQVSLFDRTAVERKNFSLKRLLQDQTDLKSMCADFLNQSFYPISSIELLHVEKIVHSETYYNGSGTQEALRIQVSPLGFYNFRTKINDPNDCSSITTKTIRERFSLKKN